MAFKKKVKKESPILKSMREMREGTHPGMLEKEEEFKKLKKKYDLKESLKRHIDKNAEMWKELAKR